MKILKTFLSRPRLLPQDQDQDQDSGSQDEDQDQDFIFCPRGASRPRLWYRGLHHWLLLITWTDGMTLIQYISETYFTLQHTV